MTEDQVAKKVIDDNFRNLSKEAVYIRRFDGLTLFERIKRDKADSKVVFGAIYYSTLREQYRSSGDVMTALKPRNDKEVSFGSQGGSANGGCLPT